MPTIRGIPRRARQPSHRAVLRETTRGDAPAGLGLSGHQPPSVGHHLAPVPAHDAGTHRRGERVVGVSRRAGSLRLRRPRREVPRLAVRHRRGRGRGRRRGRLARRRQHAPASGPSPGAVGRHARPRGGHERRARKRRRRRPPERRAGRGGRLGVVTAAETAGASRGGAVPGMDAQRGRSGSAERDRTLSGRLARACGDAVVVGRRTHVAADDLAAPAVPAAPLGGAARAPVGRARLGGAPAPGRRFRHSRGRRARDPRGRRRARRNPRRGDLPAGGGQPRRRAPAVRRAAPRRRDGDDERAIRDAPDTGSALLEVRGRRPLEDRVRNQRA